MHDGVGDQLGGDEHHLVNGALLARDPPEPVGKGVAGDAGGVRGPVEPDLKGRHGHQDDGRAVR